MKSIFILAVSVLVVFSVSAQNIDSTKLKAIDIAIEDFLDCHLSKDSNMFYIHIMPNNATNIELFIIREDIYSLSDRFLMHPTLGLYLPGGGSLGCVERGDKIFYWYCDEPISSEELALLAKYDMLYYTESVEEWEMMRWEKLSGSYNDDTIKAATYRFCPANVELYKREIGTHSLSSKRGIPGRCKAIRKSKIVQTN